MQRTEGLCGNFNCVQEDDFTDKSGVVQTSVSTWGQTWMTAPGDCKEMIRNSLITSLLSNKTKEKSQNFHLEFFTQI